MRRILLCLPLCLILGSDRAVLVPTRHFTEYPALVADKDGELPKPPELERQAKTSPLTFLENCLRRYQREVKGFSCTMQKQEFIDGKLYPTEVVEVRFRDKPHSVYMQWLEGTRRAERVLFVMGENDDKMLCRPAGKAARFVAGDVVSRDVDGPDARTAGRYFLTTFGLRKAMERTLTEWKAALDDPAMDLKFEYLGIKKLKEANDRPCYAIRSSSKKPDKNGISECTIYVDTETWLQIGTVLKGEKGELLGAYFWRDLKLNPDFKKDDFKRAALMP